jgi:hypothetical protein
MPLQSSGAISLLNIFQEFGGPSQIRLGDYYRGGSYVPDIPTNINIPTSGTISFSNFYSATSIVYLITSIGNVANNNGIFYKVATDSLKNIYLCGVFRSNVSARDHQYIVKYNQTGVLQWQRALLATFGTSSIAYGIAVHPSTGNIYIAGDNGESSSSSLSVVKLDTNGTLQWQRRYANPTSGWNSEGFGVALDSSENVYISGEMQVVSGGSGHSVILKFNSSGTLQWQRRLGGPSDTCNASGIAVDPSGNCYITGLAGVSGIRFLVAKYNTSGTLQWQRTLGVTSNLSWGESIVADSSGNCYVGGRSNNPPSLIGLYDIIVAKYNTSGVLQWQRGIGTNISEIGYGIGLDSSSNVYVAGVKLIAKYNTNGTLQWQNAFTSPSTLNLYGLSVDSASSPGTENYYVCGSENNPNATAGTSGFMMKVSTNGTFTGTYASRYTYSGVTYPNYTSTLSSLTSTLSEVAGTLSLATPSMNISTPTLTNTRTFIT